MLAEARLSTLPGMRKRDKGSNPENLPEGWEILRKVLGSQLKDLRYEPIFPFFEADMKVTAYKVCCDGYVTDDSGTGVVHQAPAYGEDDFRVCIANGVVVKGGILPDPVDANGCFCHPVPDPYLGKHVKEADKDLIAAIKNMVRPNIFKLTYERPNMHTRATLIFGLT